MYNEEDSITAEIAALINVAKDYDPHTEAEILSTPLWSEYGVRVLADKEDTREVEDIAQYNEVVIGGDLARHVSWVFFQVALLFADRPEYFEEIGLLKRMACAANNYLKSFAPMHRTPFALMLRVLQEARESVFDYVLHKGERSCKLSTRFLRRTVPVVDHSRKTFY